MISPRLAEVAAENWLKAQGYQTRRTVRTQWQKVDFFGADVIGKLPEETVYIQVTTAKRSKEIMLRKRKLEKIPWVETDYVYLFQCVERRDVLNPRRLNHYFRVYAYEEYIGSTHKWRSADPVFITPDMLKAHSQLPKEDSGAIDSERESNPSINPQFPGSSGTNEGD